MCLPWVCSFLRLIGRINEVGVCMNGKKQAISSAHATNGKAAHHWASGFAWNSLT